MKKLVFTPKLDGLVFLLKTSCIILGHFIMKRMTQLILSSSDTNPGPLKSMGDLPCILMEPGLSNTRYLKMWLPCHWYLLNEQRHMDNEGSNPELSTD